MQLPKPLFKVEIRAEPPGDNSKPHPEGSLTRAEHQGRPAGTLTVERGWGSPGSPALRKCLASFVSAEHMLTLALSSTSLPNRNAQTPMQRHEVQVPTRKHPVTYQQGERGLTHGIVTAQSTEQRRAQTIHSTVCTHLTNTEGAVVRRQSVSPSVWNRVS